MLLIVVKVSWNVNHGASVPTTSYPCLVESQRACANLSKLIGIAKWVIISILNRTQHEKQPLYSAIWTWAFSTTWIKLKVMSSTTQTAAKPKSTIVLMNSVE